MAKLSLIERRKKANQIALDYCYGNVLFGINQAAKKAGLTNEMVSNAVDHVKKTKPQGEIKKGR